MSNHNLTQEYTDCKSIVGHRDSALVEIQNFHNSIKSIIDEMAIIDADSPRRAAFETIYGKMTDDFTRQSFDAYLAKIQALKTHLEDEEWIE